MIKERKKLSNEFIAYKSEREWIEEEINELKKKYQEQPDTFVKDYDEMICKLLFGVLANFNANGIIRDDLVSNIRNLISFRKIIIDFYGDYSSSNNQK